MPECIMTALNESAGKPRKEKRIQTKFDLSGNWRLSWMIGLMALIWNKLIQFACRLINSDLIAFDLMIEDIQSRKQIAGIKSRIGSILANELSKLMK